MIIDLLTEKQKKHLIYKNLNKDETLFHEDENCNYIGIVISGNIQIISYLKDGSEILYNSLSKGDLFGNNLIFSSDIRYKGNIIASCFSEIALLSKEDLLSILSENRSFLIEYLNKQSDFAKKLNNTIKLLSIADAKERFMFYMHTNQGKISFVSVTGLAKDLYLKRETVSRLIGKLEEEGIILRERNTITMYNQI